MKYMLIKTYSPAAYCDTSVGDWEPEEIQAHIDFQRTLGEELAKSGELVDAQGLSDPGQARIVMSDGRSAPVVTDGPFPETKEFLAGYWIVDVDSPERAVEIAAKASAAPGPGGKPIGEYIEVRPIMSAPPAAEL
ncbi:YciI family protein [Nocardia sp. JMUB6875]|uniref:YciI family protein n=1 Tax=Nocardia sp. JMUB6875 TaxID=3158170 RepID=UPI0034E8BCB2